MRTRKRICAAVLTAVFAAVLCLTGCSRAPRLYEGVWAAEDLEVNGLSIDRLEMAVELCSEEPAWDEYDTLLADGIWYLVTFTVNGEECETVSVTYYGKEMKTTLFTWRESFLELGGQLHRISKENVFEGRIRLYEDDVDWNTVASAEVQLFPQG